MNTKRTTLNFHDTCHLYELSYENFQEGCLECEKLRKKLETLIGETDVKIIKKKLKKYPYKDN